jgi:aminomethyltransferase
MGQIFFEGSTALDTLQSLLTNNIAVLAPDHVRYSLMCTEQGGIIDDLTVYRFHDDRFLLVVNGATKDKDYAWMKKRAVHKTRIEDASDRFALFALQGPCARALLQSIASSTYRRIQNLSYYSFHSDASVGLFPAIVACLGYTGEDGFEIMCEVKYAPMVWGALCEAGEKFGLALCGLAARDILRLEAGMPLYGKDLDESHTPLEAGLEKFVAFDKGDFIGRDALLAQKTRGVIRRLVGLTRGIPALMPENVTVIKDGAPVGVTKSSAISPVYGGIGTAYVEAELAVPGTAVEVRAGKRTVPALISALPFYRRPRATPKEAQQ